MCAYVRMVWASFYTVFFSDLNPQVYFCDQVCKYGFTRMLLMSYLITFSYSSGINVHTSFKDIHLCASPILLPFPGSFGQVGNFADQHM